MTIMIMTVMTDIMTIMIMTVMTDIMTITIMTAGMISAMIIMIRGMNSMTAMIIPRTIRMTGNTC
jgi:hypothetical protein